MFQESQEVNMPGFRELMRSKDYFKHPVQEEVEDKHPVNETSTHDSDKLNLPSTTNLY